jgi:hypothetical protein
MALRDAHFSGSLAGLASLLAPASDARLAHRQVRSTRGRDRSRLLAPSPHGRRLRRSIAQQLSDLAKDGRCEARHCVPTGFAFNSCRQATSGRARRSHPHRLASRLLTLFMLRVAILILRSASGSYASISTSINSNAMSTPRNLIVLLLSRFYGILPTPSSRETEVHSRVRSCYAPARLAPCSKSLDLGYI